MQCSLDVHAEGNASASDQRWSNVGTLTSSCEATVHACPRDCLTLQTMGDTLVCGPPPGHYGFTQSQKKANHFMTNETPVKQWVGHQSHLFKEHLHKDSNVNNNEHQLKWSSESSSGAVKRSYAVSPQNKSKAFSQTDHPLLFELLTTNNSKPVAQSFQKSEGTCQQIDISGISSHSLKISPSGGNKFPDDDQILQLIEKKLNKFRAEMKALKEKDQRKTFTEDSMSSHVPQAAACTSNASALGRTHEAQVDTNGSKDKGASSSRKQDSEGSKVKGNDTTSAKHSPEYVRIMQDAAAICSKNEDESPVVITSLSGTTLDELIMKNPNLTLNCTSSKIEFKSQWRNVESQEMGKRPDLGSSEVMKEMVQNTMKEVASRPKLTEFSKVTSFEPPPVSLAFNTVNQPPKAKEMPFGGQQQCTAGSDYLTAHANQESNINICEGKSLPLRPSEGLMQELTGQQPIEELKTQPKEIQAGLGKVETLRPDCMAESLSLPKDSQYDAVTYDEEKSLTALPSKRDLSSHYEDISDDERQKVTVEMTQQVSNNVNACSNANTELEQESSCMTQCPNIDTSTEYEDISDDESPVLWKMSKGKKIAEPIKHMSDANAEEKRAVTDLPKQRLEMQLKCSCPYFIETEEGFEETLCPKCVKESTLEKVENQSEAGKDESFASFDPQSNVDSDNQQDLYESDDDWLVTPLTASDVKLVPEIVLDDFESGKVNKDVQNPEQCGESNLPCFQKIQEFDTLESFRQVKLKGFNKTFPSGSASPFLASDKTTSEHESARCAESDSCGTDDNCDYPSQPKHNYLSVPSHISPPLSRESNDALSSEDDVVVVVDVSKPPKRHNSSAFTKSATDTQDVDGSKFFPDLSTDEEESNYASNNQVSPGFTSKDRPPNEPTQERSSLMGKEPKIYKKRFKKNIINSDSDDETNPQCGENRKRSSSSEPGDASCQQKKKRLDKLAQNPSSLKKVTFSPKLVTSLPEAHQKQDVKQKPLKCASLTDGNGNEKVKTHKRPPSDADSKSGEVAEVSGKMAKSGITNNGKKSQIVSKLMNPNGQPFFRQSSLPNQSSSTNNKGILGKVSKTLSLDGERYEASSLPACKSSQPAQQKSSISGPNQVNSYSTVSSTPAKQLLVEQWANSYVPTRAERGNCLEKDPSSQHVPMKNSKKRDYEIIGDAVPGSSYELAPQQRHNSQEAQTPLMKRTKRQAQELTQARNRRGPKKQSRSVGEGYKWSERP